MWACLPHARSQLTPVPCPCGCRCVLNFPQPRMQGPWGGHTLAHSSQWSLLQRPSSLPPPAAPAAAAPPSTPPAPPAPTAPPRAEPAGPAAQGGAIRIRWAHTVAQARLVQHGPGSRPRLRCPTQGRESRCTRPTQIEPHMRGLCNMPSLGLQGKEMRCTPPTQGSHMYGSCMHVTGTVPAACRAQACRVGRCNRHRYTP